MANTSGCLVDTLIGVSIAFLSPIRIDVVADTNRKYGPLFRPPSLPQHINDTIDIDRRYILFEYRYIRLPIRYDP